MKLRDRFVHYLIVPFFLFTYLLVIINKKIIRVKSITQRKPRLIWGPVPLITNKYWSNALREEGFESLTLMSEYYNKIHKKSDFDLYTYELKKFGPFQGTVKKTLLYYLCPYYSFLFALYYYDIFHHHFHGGFLADTPIWKWEGPLIQRAGCKVVITAYGADFYRYSKINYPSLRHVLLINYAEAAKNEVAIQERVSYWVKYADVIITGFQVDGLGRWDVLPFSMVTIDTKMWIHKKKYSNNNGKNGTVKILHTPNHRGIKGTEFIIQAVNELKKEGLKIELILIEGRSNEYVKKIMEQEADILAEQLILGYGLSGVEGMACGLPVLSNFSMEEYTRLFRRYSYLNECPVVSATPENIRDILCILIRKPKLREGLGKAGRKYVEKYHSEITARYMFGKIYEKIWYGKEVDLMNLFHPLLSEYNKRKPYIKHPLIENTLPKKYYQK